METVYPLERLFFEMVRRGFALTMRDYADTLRALDLGYGGYTRESLLALLKRLWARSQEEVRALELLIEEFPRPSEKEINRAAGAMPGRRSQSTARKQTKPTVEPMRQNSGAAVPQIEFAQATQTGIGIPRAVFRAAPSEAFVLAERPPIPLRSMIVAWRRFRRTRRAGPPVHLDILASIAEQCRRGRLVHPVLVPERRNFASLVLLVDISPSMAALAGLVPLWRESLAESRLGATAVYYFRNAPRDRLYRHPALREPVAVNEAIRHHPGSALLVVSDAGAARGFRSRARITDTRSFLRTVASAWSPVAWLNPMPLSRWRGSSAEEISLWPEVSMFNLNEDGLTRAVDLLRGARAV
jgi:uncharacterized protein with von Willebrand factor type A (vWA) domain